MFSKIPPLYWYCYGFRRKPTKVRAMRKQNEENYVTRAQTGNSDEHTAKTQHTNMERSEVGRVLPHSDIFCKSLLMKPLRSSRCFSLGELLVCRYCFPVTGLTTICCTGIVFASRNPNIERSVQQVLQP
ncbi:hypothetical protein pdam_00011081 [Pocillopora damicornis]|uniref:Uncharacterized protein n=1 Tax=Pocillopora damicornis TaxID=46731 RepID=A0A3M6UTQ9_POCDA|nr:hypothetical protein pdam_00011081 [Pocillopora damicornis]